ncbi:MAG: hypothetical protein UY92_C0010G0041 [Candidatus Magasanikbacteria bacterium GW2011_GWA2_56_11]|uniref:Arabinofuranosyltransferase AftA N-terminal domain-containing protein n=1 Tax=Candidatus Magasanikbacteria bacterium GW2011_GWA2_56_11 TaxID=1619044 RepID=A0A0G1YG26_9BACT|nr:MAG: hypothetical protein UY92_C0010G0041 [Candidatus Magasanikbacteria bacterium GW2011_GWA2_56_11]
MELVKDLTYSDIQHLIAVKAMFYVFLAGSVAWVLRRWRLSYFLLWVGLASGLAYYFFVRHLALMFWGLQGDEVTIAAMYEMFAHGSLFSDFAYASLPPFYPALFFQVFGALGRLMDWNGVQIAKFASLFTIVVYPFVFYRLQEKYWRRRRADEFAPGPLAWFISAVLLFVFLDWDAIILKPYEMVSASLAILWGGFLLYDLWHDRFGSGRGWWYGLTGGLLFLLFYFWFFLLAIGAALFNLFYKKVAAWQYWRLAFVGAVALAVGALFWLPLALSYRELGAENWQLGFLHLPWLATHGPAMAFTLRGLLMLLALGGLIFFRSRFYPRVLLSFLAAGYVWQAMGLAAIWLFASPLQEAKGFHFFNTIVLALAAAYFLERVWLYLLRRYPAAAWRTSAALVGVIALSGQLFFGTFADEPVVQRNRSLARSPYAGVTELAAFLRDRGDAFTKVSVQPGSTHLPAFAPLNTFVYYNMHNSHPAANFSDRLLFLEELGRARTPEEFYRLARENRFGPIDRFILFPAVGGEHRLYFTVDNFPHESRERVIVLPAGNFAEPWFAKVYESPHFVVFEPRTR